MKRQSPSSFKKPPIKRQNASSDLTTLKRKVSKLERLPEVKACGFLYAGTPVPDGSNRSDAALACSGIAQGTDQINRIGNSIRCKTLNVRLTVSPSAGASTRHFRVLIFTDRAHNGSPSLPISFANNQSILDSYASIATPVQNMSIHHDMKRRYKILRDKSFAIAINSDNVSQTIQHFSILLNDLKIDYIGTSANNDDVLKNMLQVHVLETHATGTLTLIQAQLLFTDA